MNLLKAAFGTSAMIFASRITGLFREILFARVFGVSEATDAFLVAFRIPNLLRRMFAEGAFSQAFVPVLGEVKNAKGDEATREFVAQVASLLTAALLFVSIIGVIAAPALVYAMGSGLAANADQFAMATQLLRIMFPYILFISLVSLASGVLNTYGKFQLPAVAPVLLNVTALVALIFIIPRVPEAQRIHVMAWSVFAGGVLQLALVWYGLKRINMLPGWNWAPKADGVMKLLKLMLPAMLGVSVAQISLIINTQYASHMAIGSVSWLSYADRLMEFPSALLGVAIGTVILPSLVKFKVASDGAGFSRLVDWGLRLTLMLAVPATAALAVISIPLLVTIYGGGKFKTEDVFQTQSALLGYCVGLVGIVAVKILAPSFYAKQDIKTPLKVAIVTLIITQLCNIALIPYFKHAALALSISIGATFNSLVLLVLLRTKGGYTPLAGWFMFICKVVVASAVMTGLLWWLMGDPNIWLQYSLIERLLRLALLVVSGGAAYLVVLLALGVRPRHFRQMGA
jgi:putative peptidoglycan lipid II flippase